MWGCIGNTRNTVLCTGNINTQQHDDNILIEVPKDTYKPIKGSLRFNYMFPAPPECVTELIIANESEKRRNLLNKELNFVLNNESRIRNRARQTYSKVTNKVNSQIVTNSCDFKLLEEACEQYKKTIVNNSAS